MIPLNEVVEYAFEAHASINHMYDGMSYSYHLKSTAKVVKQFIHLIPKEHRDEVLAAAYCHDMIEDTFETYNDLKKRVHSYLVAEIVYAVSNEKGRNRAERANEKYYKGIRKQKYASFIKLCDRIANLTHGKSTGSGMFMKYKDELNHFLELVVDSEKRIEYNEMISHLVGLFEE